MDSYIREFMNIPNQYDATSLVASMQTFSPTVIIKSLTSPWIPVICKNNLFGFHHSEETRYV